MGKSTGFLEIDRRVSLAIEPKDRIKNFKEFHIPLSREQQRAQGARCMECGVSFCHAGVVMNGKASGCPLNNLIPEWNDFLYTGNLDYALSRLLKTNNFPEFTSRVCPAPCEAACTCGLYGAPVTIRENEWAIVENGFEEGLMGPSPPTVRTGKRVAVVGSGPAGLAAADQLNKRGHSVTVFERADRPGGLLLYGIPNMKLEKGIVERRIRLMEKEGVVFECNADIGCNIAGEMLLAEYDAIVLACGASNPRDIQVPGREAKGIHFAVDFLKSTNKSLLDSGMKDRAYIDAKNKQVLVIGGGDTGNDCVGTALRHGAASVVQLEMMPKLPESRGEDNPWPEWPNVGKTDYGQEECIVVYGSDPRLYETTVKEFIVDEEGNICGAVVVSLEWQKDSKSGRMLMEEVPGSERVINADLVLIAAGFLGTEAYIAEAFGLELDERTNTATRSGSYETAVEKVFVAGDMRRGQSLVVWAIREGREAAKAVDHKLMGYTNLE